MANEMGIQETSTSKDGSLKKGIDEKQIHIRIGCADARDLNYVQVEGLAFTIDEYLKKGIEIEFHEIRSAGSFITPDVVMDIKRTFEKAQREEKDLAIPISYFVHIQTHGHLTADSSDSYVSHVHELKIVEGSPLNCGMLNASSVGVEIEQMIVQECPEIIVKGKVRTIHNDTMVKKLLKEHYAYDGYLAGDWIKSIDLLRTHTRSQRTVLEKTIANDSELKMLDIKTTCGIQDYAIHSLIRVDDGDPEVPFWDDMQRYIRDHVENDRGAKEKLMDQSKVQKPLAGLLSMSDPRMASRVLAAEYYLNLKGITYSEYPANTIFNMTGSSFDIPFTPFGPYVIAGFFYAVKALGLTDQLVMGYDQAQTQRILQKIKNDPIMNMIANKYKVELIPVNLVDVLPG